MNSSRRLGELRRDLTSLAGRPSHSGDHDTARGRDAERPGEIPSRGWLDVIWRAWGEVGDANLFLVAGGVTYAVLLALFPGLAALIALYGLVLDPSQIEQQVAARSGVLPEQTRHLLVDELHKLAAASNSMLGLSAIVGLLIAIWSASRGMSGTITALNIAYEEKEGRGFIKLNLVAVALTLIFMVGGLLVIALIAGAPAAVELVSAAAANKWLVLVLEWPLMIIVVMAGLAVLYRYAPDRAKPQWRWVSPGAIVATTLWIVASIGFTIYVANFNSYDKTYGSLGGVVILLTWLYLSALMVLFGAAINAQSEKQTRKDSTEGPPARMGDRHARAADVLGPTRD
jgi:membrane protein